LNTDSTSRRTAAALVADVAEVLSAGEAGVAVRLGGVDAAEVGADLAGAGEAGGARE
jgi:hypothetical protein